MSHTPNEIIFVCTANTCRSPMAEGLFRHALAAESHPIKDYKVSSSGVSAFQGQSAAANAVEALKKVGIDISNHSSKPLTQEQVDNSIAFFGMTESHLAMLSLQIDPPPRSAFLMRGFLPEDADPEIPDPFGMSLSHYEACRDSMVEAIPSLLKVLRELHDRPLG